MGEMLFHWWMRRSVGGLTSWCTPCSITLLTLALTYRWNCYSHNVLCGMFLCKLRLMAILQGLDHQEGARVASVITEAAVKVDSRPPQSPQPYYPSKHTLPPSKQPLGLLHFLLPCFLPQYRSHLSFGRPHPKVNKTCIT